jgi:hypothetical protein
MDKAIGILKIGASVALSLACVMVYANIKPGAGAETYIGTSITVAIFCIYIYYLITTGINNIKSEPYRLKIIPIVGLVLHFVFIILLLTVSYQIGGAKVLLTSCVPAIAGVVILILDVRKYVGIWKARKFDQISN